MFDVVVVFSGIMLKGDWMKVYKIFNWSFSFFIQDARIKRYKQKSKTKTHNFRVDVRKCFFMPKVPWMQGTFNFARVLGLKHFYDLENNYVLSWEEWITVKGDCLEDTNILHLSIKVCKKNHVLIFQDLRIL